MGELAAFDELLAALRTRDDADPDVASEQRSFARPGRPGAGAVVLLHGLTASPRAWRRLADAFAARGRTVVVPRLLLHGHRDRMTTALRALRAEALVADTAAVLRAVLRLGERVTVCGHSLGATLAIDAAARIDGLTRVVAVAPFLGIAHLPPHAHGVVLRAARRLPNVFLWWDPRVRERLEPAHGYPRYPLQALVTGLTIGERARVAGGAHAATIDLVLNARESSVSNRAALRLARTWRSAGASVAVHELRGLGLSHDIIEPDRPYAQRAQRAIEAIVETPHIADGRVHEV